MSNLNLKEKRYYYTSTQYKVIQDMNFKNIASCLYCTILMVIPSIYFNCQHWLFTDSVEY